MSTLYNRARVSTATAGTGTMTLGAVTSNAFFTFAEAGVANLAVVSYVIEDGLNVEIGIGTYTSAGTTLSRDTVTASKIAGVAGTTKLTLSGTAIVYIDALAADITVPPASAGDNNAARFDGTTGRLIQDSALNIGDDGACLTNGAGCGWLAYDRTGSGNGFLTFYRNGTFTIFDDTSNVFLTEDGSTRFVGIGNGFFGPIRSLHVKYNDSAATNTVNQVLRLQSTSSGVPANGIGTGLEFQAETAAANDEIGATIEAYAWDTTAASEDFDLVFKTMSAGAAATEKGRTGFMPVNMIQNDSMSLLASNSMVVSTKYTIPTGLTLTLAADSVMRIL